MASTDSVVTYSFPSFHWHALDGHRAVVILEDCGRSEDFAGDLRVDMTDGCMEDDEGCHGGRACGSWFISPVKA